MTDDKLPLYAKNAIMAYLMACDLQNDDDFATLVYLVERYQTELRLVALNAG